MLQRILLLCGVLSPVLYGVADLLAGLQWTGYSFRDQTISELGAIGAPSRLLFSVLLVVVYLLMVAFGAGVWRAAAENRRLRIAGGLLIALGVMAVTVGQFAPMQPRGEPQGFTGTLHLVEGAAAMLMIFTSMGIAASAFGTPFRLYTIATIVLALGFGAWAAMEAPSLVQDLPTPWLGVKERIFWYGYQSWYITFAVVLLRPGERGRPRSPTS
jgi:hypothetical membrane protein